MTPPVAVVVSAYNRSALIEDLVSSLKAQSVEDFEAVLVDNGSDDDTESRLIEHTRDDPRFRVMRVEGNRGPGRARNEAWRSTSAPLVAFTDDDCRPAPDWLEKLVAASAGADIVQGLTEPGQPMSDRPRNWFDRTQRIESWSGRFETCNLAVRRSWLERLGGFDERFHIAMGEDTDLGLRAVAEGATTSFAADAIVRHQIWPGSFWEYLRQRRRYAEVVEMFRVRPESRSLLRGRLVLRDVHAMLLSLPPMTLVAWRLGWWWVPLLLIPGWVVHNAWRTRIYPFSWPTRLGYSALLLTAYAYETWCFLRASVRYRTVVL